VSTKQAFSNLKNLLQLCLSYGSVTMTTEVGTDGATTLSRMNFSGYVGHVTIFSLTFTIACCLVVGLGLG